MPLPFGEFDCEILIFSLLMHHIFKICHAILRGYQLVINGVHQNNGLANIACAVIFRIQHI